MASTACRHARAARLRVRCGHFVANSAGQATVEFAVVLFAFLALLAGLGSLFDFGSSGALVDHAIESASHHIASGDVGAWGDVLVY